MARYGEPTIDEALADPMILAVMRADRQDPHEVAAVLRAVARRLGVDRRADTSCGPKPGFSFGRFLRECQGAAAPC